MVHIEKKSSNKLYNFRRVKIFLFTCLDHCLNNSFVSENPADARTTGEPVATLLVITAVGATMGEADETMKIA